MSDELVFIAEDDTDIPPRALGGHALPWKILVIDDDDGVHSSTRFALERVSVDGRPLEIIDLYSAEEAREYLDRHDDVALALVDVVMESDHAGLDLVQWVRESKGNQAIRLVLRTGQPGQAPERHVVVNYDIDDYKTKSELTAQKLFTLLHASLRSYRHIRALERNQRGLELIINSAAELCLSETAGDFARGVLEQVTALLNLDDESVICDTEGLTACANPDCLSIIAGSGDYAGMVGKNPYEVLPSELQAMFAESLASRATVFRNAHCVCFTKGRDRSAALIYFRATREIADNEKPLIELFARNIGLAFCNWRLRERVCAECDKRILEDR